MDSNLVIQRERPIIDQISDMYNYDSNIRHLLYIIIPAFIIKYGVQKEKLIIDAFKKIKIVSSDKQSETIKAYYSSVPKLINNEYKTVKHMVIQNYNKIRLVELLDNLVHEFNHAINSHTNEILEKKNYLYLRTGLTYRVYKKQDLSFVRKDQSYILEEIINTKQTNDIINIIKGFNPNDSEIDNTIYAINSETSHKYNSNSYYLQGYICRQILENKTFINTLENLRINGEVYDIRKWFDDIMGKEGTYKELVKTLEEVYNLELEYVKKKWFKTFTLSKIRDKSSRIMEIVRKFNNNVNFK
jgi:hypothetical protein